MVGIWTIWAYSQPVSGIELCYAVNGKVMANYNVTACEPETAIRRCCSRADLCADNGLCLNAGGDNLWTIQGCTDWFWRTISQILRRQLYRQRNRQPVRLCPPLRKGDSGNPRLLLRTER
jgi:hypothetical protein